MIFIGIHPIQCNSTIEAYFEAELADEREVTDSGGHKEMRYVISTHLLLGDKQWPIEITLTNRDNMKFRMLIGRSALVGKAMVNPKLSFSLGEPSPEELIDITNGENK